MLLQIGLALFGIALIEHIEHGVDPTLDDLKIVEVIAKPSSVKLSSDFVA